MALTANKFIQPDGAASGGKQQTKSATWGEEALAILSGGQAIQLDIAPSGLTHSPGQISYDAACKGPKSDMGYGTGVQAVSYNHGEELYVPFLNDTGVQIDNGKAINAQGFDVTEEVLKGILFDSTSAATSSSFIGLATHDVPNGEVGLATYTGKVRDFDTSLLSGGPLYGGTSGDLTNTRPQYPAKIFIVGSLVKADASTGVVQVLPADFRRFDVSTSASFTSQGVGAGTFYKGGFYDWATTSVTLTQASLTQTYGVAGRSVAAHVGIVPSASGTVDTGQVGLQVTGTFDSETGIQIASQTKTITEDITTLNANEYNETVGKFSGQVTFELYVVSGSPTAYSLTFNYGFSKYEDFFDRDATIVGLQCQWQGNANDSAMNIRLLHHKATGWTYAATGFVPGDGVICARLTDQQIESDVDTGADGSYKRNQLNTFVNSGGSEGVLLEITTNQNNTIQTMDINIIAVSEELT